MTKPAFTRGDPIVFCDFDGTITVEDLIVAVWRGFASDGWQDQVTEILSQRKPLKEGVAEIFAQVRTSEKDAIVEYAKRVVALRPGFQELLESCAEMHIDFLVVSGGIDFFVEPVMESFKPWIKRMYTIPADLSGDFIALQHPYACETCGICKARVMDEYLGAYRIVVGDGVTDLHGARKADLVFARGQLSRLLGDEGIPYEPFETFFDVKDALGRRLSQMGASPPRGP